MHRQGKTIICAFALTIAIGVTASAQASRQADVISYESQPAMSESDVANPVRFEPISYADFTNFHPTFTFGHYSVPIVKSPLLSQSLGENLLVTAVWEAPPLVTYFSDHLPDFLSKSTPPSSLETTSEPLQAHDNDPIAGSSVIEDSPCFVTETHHQSSATTFHYDKKALSYNRSSTVTTVSSDVKAEKLLDSVPWSATIQWQIYQDVCNFDPEKFCALMATAKTESEFETDLVGDHGESFGPFQIQPKWHQERMERHDVATGEDLFDPVKSAAVALDLFEELIETNDYSGYCVEVSVIYNAGHYTTCRSVKTYATKVYNQYQDYLAEFAEINTTTLVVDIKNP